MPKDKQSTDGWRPIEVSVNRNGLTEPIVSEVTVGGTPDGKTATPTRSKAASPAKDKENS